MTEKRKAYKKAYQKAYREEHRDEVKEYNKVYIATHKTELKEYKKEYNKSHKTKIKTYRKEYMKSYQRQQYCCQDISQIENYSLAKADNFIKWDIHHRLETNNSDGEHRLVDIASKELMKLDMYYNRPASELIFMKHGDHVALHNKGKKH